MTYILYTTHIKFEFADANKFIYLDPGVKPQDDKEYGGAAPRMTKRNGQDSSQDDKKKNVIG